MKRLCSECTVPGCLLNYMGKGCRNARKEYCPWVKATRLNSMEDMDLDQLAVMLSTMVAEVKDCDDFYEAIKAWLSVEVEK